MLVRAAVAAKPNTMNDFFRRIAHWSSRVMGSPWAFIIASLAVVVWAITGPFFNYSDTWQLVINTATTVLTFLAVFLIQNTQNRDAHALHLKLDEIIRAIDPARNELIDIEDLSDAELEEYEKDFKRIRAERQEEQAKEGA